MCPVGSVLWLEPPKQGQDQDLVKANRMPGKIQLRPGPNLLKFHATVQVAVQQQETSSDICPLYGRFHCKYETQ